MRKGEQINVKGKGVQIEFCLYMRIGFIYGEIVELWGRDRFLKNVFEIIV